MQSFNIFEHNGFHTNTIFTKAVSPLCISVSTPRTPSTVQKPRLVSKAHLTPNSQTNNALQNFPPVYISRGEIRCCGSHKLIHFVLPTDAGHVESKHCCTSTVNSARLTIHTPQSIALQMVRPPVLLQVSCLDNETAMTIFTGTLLA